MSASAPGAPAPPGGEWTLPGLPAAAAPRQIPPAATAAEAAPAFDFLSGAGQDAPWDWWCRETVLLGLLITFLVLVMPIMAYCVIQIESSYVVGFPPWHVWALGFHLLGLILGLPSVYLAFRSRSPLRALRAVLTQGASSELDEHGPQTVLTQAIAAMALQPPQAGPQMLFSQNVGIGTSNIAASGFGGLFGGSTGVEAAAQGSRNSTPNGSLPWQDLSCLSEQVARLLGRSASLGRRLPPAQMPQGELYSFLSVLQSATSQLGVGISDFQAGLVDGGGRSVEQAQHLSTALQAAARSLASAAVAIQGETGDHLGSNGGDAQEMLFAPGTEASAASDFASMVSMATTEATAESLPPGIGNLPDLSSLLPELIQQSRLEVID